MCGIVGIMGFNGRPVDREVLGQMTAGLAHRGPEGQGVQLLAAGPVQVGLGHTRLKIIDLSDAAAQPMANGDRSVWVTFNGEIYNYRELRDSLEMRGARFRTSSDTEVILHLYEEKGERCVEELDGMFAFALWDSRCYRLLLARDRVGKKPLFYHHDTKLFAFASEIKAFFRNPEISMEIDPAAIPGYFIYGYVPTPASFYRGVFSLPPGHTLTVMPDGRYQTRQYWDLAFSANDAYNPTLTDDGLVASQVKDLVTEAVRKRLYADVPLGAFLSGGVDSSIVVGVMSQLMKEPVKTFSIGFAGDAAFDETRYARIAAQHFKTDHTEFVVEPNAIDLVEALVWHHDGPFGDSSAIPTHIVSRLTKEHVTVALNGDGGDELFAGYPRFYGGILADRIPAPLMYCVNFFLSLFPEHPNYYHPIRRAQRFFQTAGSSFYERYARWISFFYDDLESLLDRELWGTGNSRDRIAYFDGFLGKVSNYTPLSRLLYLNTKTYLVDDLLVKMDRMTMANGLEARSPFLDQALMEYAVALPDSMKLRRGVTKYILKRAFSDLLPPEISRRGKMGFGVPLGAWFRGDLRQYVCDLLLASDARMRDYLNQDYVGKLIQEHIHAKRDHGLRLWAVLTFEVWLRALKQWIARPEAAAYQPAISSERLYKAKNVVWRS